MPNNEQRTGIAELNEPRGIPAVKVPKLGREGIEKAFVKDDLVVVGAEEVRNHLDQIFTSDGEPLRVTAVYPASEMYLDSSGWHANYIWPDRKEPLKWSRIKGRWRRTFWNWLKGPRRGRTR